MKTFAHFILEEKKFAKAIDQDFTVDDHFVLVFNPTDDYRVSNDKTHDGVSHALKHLPEFDPSFMKTIMSSVFGRIVEAFNKDASQYFGIKNRGGSIVSFGEDAIKKMTVYILGNTLDLINDKLIERKPLSLLEKELHAKYARKIETKYKDIINSKLAIYTDLDKERDKEQAIRDAQVIKFNGWQRVAVEVVLDFRDNSIIICTPDYVRTMFVFDRPASSKKEVLKNFLLKKIEIDDMELKKIVDKLVYKN